MDKEMVIDFRPGGTVQSLYYEKFPLNHVLKGKMKSERASEIVLNEQTQFWQVVLPGHTDAYVFAHGFSTYGQAREFEEDWLGRCRALSVAPDSPEGERCGFRTRIDFVERVYGVDALLAHASNL